MDIYTHILIVNSADDTIYFFFFLSQDIGMCDVIRNGQKVFVIRENSVIQKSVAQADNIQEQKTATKKKVF